MQGSVRKRGSIWYYRYYVYEDGKRKQIERKGGPTKREALEKLNEEIYNLNIGFERPKETLFSGYLDMWVEDFVKPTKSVNTYSSYRNSIDKYISPYLGSLKLCDVKPIHIEKFLNKMRNTKQQNGKLLTSTTIQKHYLVLSAALNKAMKLQLINQNPCEFVDTPKRSKHTANILTVDELSLIYNKLDTNKYEDYIFFLGISLTIETGLRRGEMCGLQWCDIDFDNEVLTCNNALIRQNNIYTISTLKTDSSYRQLPLSDNILNLLKQHKKIQLKNKIRYGELYTDSNKFNNINYDLIFTEENGKYLIPSRFLQRIKRLCKYCNIEKNIRWHDLRHSNATFLLKLGISMKVIQERLGHSIMQTTSDIYAHVTKDMNIEATNILSNSLYEKTRAK
ncbi:MAG: tyrosine-type recombinase/integrase [Clostridium sp.]|uniref:tyrosine-type recombinase/integrase n=1 Tax=Clostridium sp. TaxID=1506 RepID=UPI002902EDAA|nr:tyrosine-type recombinase/integrase [Clostridium sp.]MDU1601549.1 tyrosine-type recombinase/integrase [Clostridium sp.]